MARSLYSPAALIVLGAIALYQRHLSPRKGFSCAMRVHAGGPSCSAAVASLVRTHGVFGALPLVVERFRACAAAASAHAQQATGTASRPVAAGDEHPADTDATQDGRDASPGLKAVGTGVCAAEGACAGCGIFSWLSG
ncbi:MAG: membrane protein insertion efficiency factor YidD [Xanthomonadales bacterium]|nr:membrane protein insertion efficiency factor YidD [Xanthomonadales bacterium]